MAKQTMEQTHDKSSKIWEDCGKALKDMTCPDCHGDLEVKIKQDGNSFRCSCGYNHYEGISR